MPDQSEDELRDVAAACSGDRAALERVVGAVEPLVSRLALRFFGCPQHAQDATQEALVQIVIKLDRFAGQSAFRTWVYRVATNKFLSMARSRAERAAMTFEAFDEDLTHPIEPTDQTSSDVDHDLLVAEVRIGCTLAMLLCLDRDARMAYILGAIAELDHQTAADILGCAAATYRKRLERARDAITLDAGALRRVRRRKRMPVRRPHPCRPRAGWLDPKHLLFATSADQARRFPELLPQIRRLEEVQRAAAIYQSHPDPETRVEFVTRLHGILAAGRDESNHG